MARRGENIYKRRDGRWEGRYIRGHTPSGKAEYGYVYAKTYAMCREKQRQQMCNATDAEKLPDTLTVGQASACFMNSKKGELKPSSYSRYDHIIRQHILPELGTIQLQELTEEKVTLFLQRLQKRGLSAKSTRDIAVLLKSILKAGIKQYKCTCPGLGAALPAYRGKHTDVFTPHEISTLARQVVSAPDMTGLAILLVLNTGLRLGELCALKKSDIDMQSGTLRIERTVQRIEAHEGTQLVIQPPKSENSRRCVPLPADMLALLKKEIRKLPAEAFLLTGSTQRPMEPRTMQYRYKAYLLRCGIRYRNFHTLRHTYATRCMECGVDTKSISEMLGHADVRITLRTYVHSSMTHKRQVIQSICFLPQVPVQKVNSPSKSPSGMPCIAAPPEAGDLSFANCN